MLSTNSRLDLGLDERLFENSINRWHYGLDFMTKLNKTSRRRFLIFISLPLLEPRAELFDYIWIIWFITDGKLRLRLNLRHKSSSL